MIVVLLGPPGAGKGTQGERIAKSLGVPKISTGDVIRDAMSRGTPLGREAKAFYDKGDLVPDAVIMGIIRDVLAAPEQAQGVVLDGVVRTVPQAEGLSAVLGELRVAGEQAELRFVHLHHQRVPAPADRAVAARQLGEVGLDFEAHGAAVAAAAVGLQGAR